MSEFKPGDIVMYVQHWDYGTTEWRLDCTIRIIEEKLPNGSYIWRYPWAPRGTICPSGARNEFYSQDSNDPQMGWYKKIGHVTEEVA